MNLVEGVPGALAVFILDYNKNIFRDLTHYSSDQAVVYYGTRTVKLLYVLEKWDSLVVRSML